MHERMRNEMDWHRSDYIKGKREKGKGKREKGKGKREKKS